MNQKNIIYIVVLFGISLVAIFQLVRNKKEGFSPGNPNDVSMINKDAPINQNPNLLSLQKFKHFAEKGERGEMGLKELQKSGKLWLGGPDYGYAGENIDNEVQLYLGGKHKHGANNGRDGHTTYKLKIDSYDNDKSVVYPIYCEDENKKVDFYIKNGINNLPSQAYFGGNLEVNNNLHCQNIFSDSLAIENELLVNKKDKGDNNWLITSNLKNDALVIIKDKDKLNVQKGYVFNRSGFLHVPDSMRVLKNIKCSNIKTKKVHISEELNVKKLSINGKDVKNYFIPSGIIIAFGKPIKDMPQGWVICDGKNGTPDLRNKFIIGQGPNYPYNKSGGTDTIKLTIDNLPKHKHTIDLSGGHKHKYKDIYWADKNGVVPIGNDHGRTIDMGDNDKNNNPISKGYEKIRYTDKSTSEHKHDMSEVGNSKPHTNMPPYYSLYYIMKI